MGTSASRPRSSLRGKEETQPVVSGTEQGAPRHLLLSAGQAAALCGVSRRTWWALHAAGKTPLPVRLGRRTLWRASGPGGLEAWVAAGCPPRDRWDGGKTARASAGKGA